MRREIPPHRPPQALLAADVPQASRLPRPHRFFRTITLHCRVLLTVLPLFAFGRPYQIEGTLIGPSGGFADVIARLEADVPQTTELFYAAMSKEPVRKPVSGTTVELSWDGGHRTVHTDPEGHFCFSGLEGNRYELFARQGKAIAHACVVLRHGKDRHIDLRLNPIHVAIRGKITDDAGNPVAGAKIKATYHSPHAVYQQYLENHEASWWTATSDKNGHYELTGIDPANYYHLGGFLVARKSCRSFVKIQVASEGLQQDGIPQVPIITEEVLGLSRRLLAVYKQIPGSEAAGLQEYDLKPVPPAEVLALWQEFDPASTTELPIPSSQENTITGMDFVLKKTNPGDSHGRNAPRTAEHAP